jgi:hypothetical protein
MTMVVGKYGEVPNDEVLEEIRGRMRKKIIEAFQQ